MIKEPKDYIQIGIEWFRDLMKSIGCTIGSQTKVPGKSCRQIKSSEYPGKQSYKPSIKSNTKSRRRNGR